MRKIFVIGGMKCGTSSFYYMFRKNPQVCLTKFKETSFFTKRNNKGMSWYNAQFEPKETTEILMDVSPSYSKKHLFPDCAQKIHDYDSDSKIIYIVRDPLERIISNIQHDMLRGRIRTKNLTHSVFSDGNYIKTSAYHYQIESYVTLFGAANVLVISFEELKNNLEKKSPEIFSFLGITPHALELEAQNSSEKRYVIKYHDFIHRVFGNGWMTRAYHFFWSIINIKVDKPKMTPELRKQIYDSLKDDISLFTKTYSIDETLWKAWDSLKKEQSQL